MNHTATATIKRERHKLLLDIPDVLVLPWIRQSARLANRDTMSLRFGCQAVEVLDAAQFA
jgi:hypothetical protein